MEPKQQRFSIGYIVAAVVAFFLIQSFLFGPHPENLAYSDFKNAPETREGQRPHARVANDHRHPRSHRPRAAAPQGQDRRTEAVREGDAPVRAELFDRLDVMLGGRAPEELIFGDVSTGAQDDLQRATDMARHMVAQYGMSDKLGLATFEQPRQARFLGVGGNGPRGYSEKTARTIDAAIEKTLEAAHATARETLTQKRTTLEVLAKLLIEREVVDREALTNLLAMPQVGS